MKVYIVTSGEYSDHHIVAAFSTPEAAQKLADVVEEPRVEEYELDEVDVRGDRTPFFVRMAKDGNCEVEECGWENIAKKSRWGKWDFHKNLIVFVAAKDKQHAVKIANEKRIQIIANNQWGL